MAYRGTGWRAAALLAVAATGAGQAQAIGFGLGGESYPKVQKPVSFDPAADHRADAAQFLWLNKAGGARAWAGSSSRSSRCSSW